MSDLISASSSRIFAIEWDDDEDAVAAAAADDDGGGGVGNDDDDDECIGCEVIAKDSAILFFMLQISVWTFTCPMADVVEKKSACSTYHKIYCLRCGCDGNVFWLKPGDWLSIREVLITVSRQFAHFFEGRVRW